MAFSSGGKSFTSDSPPMSEINVTPMVDVMLVLLIIFMVAAPLMMVGVPVELPRTAAAKVGQTRKPLIVKLSPNVTSPAEMARVCEGEGADAVAAINTLQALDVDVETRRPRLANGLGGLSGPAIRPVALRIVWQIAQAVRIPVCGVGGIMTGEDAAAFLLCGASAVQVGTANYLNPLAALEVVEGLEAYCERHGVARVRDLVGALEMTAR